MIAARLHVLDLRTWRPFSGSFPVPVVRDFPCRAEAEQARPAADGDRVLCTITAASSDDPEQMELSL